jgi:hypothetical protein
VNRKHHLSGTGAAQHLLGDTTRNERAGSNLRVIHGREAVRGLTYSGDYELTKRNLAPLLGHVVGTDRGNQACDECVSMARGTTNKLPTFPECVMVPILSDPEWHALSAEDQAPRRYALNARCTNYAIKDQRCSFQAQYYSATTAPQFPGPPTPRTAQRHIDEARIRDEAATRLTTPGSQLPVTMSRSDMVRLPNWDYTNEENRERLQTALQTQLELVRAGNVPSLQSRAAPSTQSNLSIRTRDSLGNTSSPPSPSRGPTGLGISGSSG